MRRWIAIALALVFLLAVVAGWVFFASLDAPARESDAAVPVTIPAGSGAKAIASQLAKDGLIRSELAFRIYLLLKGWTGGLQAGTYRLEPPFTIPNLARQLARGELNNDVRLTILEGWTNRQIADAVQAAGLGSGAAFLEAASVLDSREILPDRRYGFLTGRPVGTDLEGYLYPDTYFVFANAAPAQIIEKMLDNFDAKVDQGLRDASAARGMTIHDVVTLASIVEREVRTDEDRALVADLFLRRLDLGMALQSDATVNYVTGQDRRQPTLDDTKTESPFNTYLHPGLPPGPIGNPSLSSIRAVVDPRANEFLYFLNAPDGRTIFARTFAEHLANKQAYLP